MSGVQQTSLEAFEALRDDGTLDGDELRVLRLIEQHGPITGRELEPLMGKPVHCFSGRITKLQERGLVRSAGRVKVDGSSMNAWASVRRD
jgi:chromosome segregation and condensation protein ScpB